MEPRESLEVREATTSKSNPPRLAMGAGVKKIGLRFDPSAYGTLVVLVLGMIITSILSPAFLTVSNISNLLSQIAALGIVTMGQTIALVAGGIDLSVGS